MKAIKLTTEESEAVERAYYEASSFEALMAVLCRQLNADANPETAKVIRPLCRTVPCGSNEAEDGAGNGALPVS